MSLVSVIIPVYNAEKSLSKCIDSIINQTYRTIEILLINDGSTDNSSNICDCYGYKDARIKVIHLKNKGVANARNTGIDVAKGKYIQFVDSDDWLEEDAIEEALKAIELNKADMVIFGFIRHLTPQNYSEYKLSDSFLNTLKKEEIFKKLGSLINNEMFNSVWNKLYKRAIIVDKDIRFNVDYQNGEDFMFNMDYIKHINSISICKKCLYHYNNTQQSLSKSLSLKKFLSIKSAYDIYRMELQNNNFYNKESSKLYEQYYLKNIFMMIVDIYRNRKKVNFNYEQIIIDLFIDESIKSSLKIVEPEYMYLKIFVLILKSKNIKMLKLYLMAINSIFTYRQKVALKLYRNGK